MNKRELLDHINDSGNGRIRFDPTINVSTIISLVVLVVTIAKYGNSVVAYLGDIKSKTNVMWYYFVQDHPEAEKLLERLRQ